MNISKSDVGKKVKLKNGRIETIFGVHPSGEVIVVTESHSILRNSFRTYRSNGRYWLNDLLTSDGELDIAEILDH